MSQSIRKTRRSRRFINRLLAAILPRHGKRAIFLTTLYVQIAKISPSHKKMLEELNRQLKIVDEARALNFPISLHDAVWAGREIDLREPSQCSDLDIELLARQVMHRMPEWSRYSDDQEVILAETRKVLRAAQMDQQTEMKKTQSAEIA